MTQKWRWRSSWPYALIVVLGIGWAVSSFLAPITNNAYHLTTLQIDLLLTSIIVPLVVVWLVAVYGIRRLHAYAQQISPGEDSAAMFKISRGLGWLVAALVVVQLISTGSAYAQRAGNLESFVHVQLILTAVVYIFAFTQLYFASDHLLNTAKATTVRSRFQILPLIAFVLVSVVYVYFIFHDSYRNFPPPGAPLNSFYLSDPWILWLVVVPYVLQWLLGILTAINVRAYAITVPGVIYRQSLRRLANGVLAVVVFSMLLQFLNAIGPDLANAKLQVVVLLLYALVILYGLGFVWIALGVKRLARIEEVTR